MPHCCPYLRVHDAVKDATEEAHGASVASLNDWDERGAVGTQDTRGSKTIVGMVEEEGEGEEDGRRDVM
jgi:hypothetical protein